MINTLVTAIGGGGHGDQVLKALLLAKKNKYNIHGSDMAAYRAQAKMVSKFFQFPSANDENYLNLLLKICDEFDIEVLIHGCEPELKVFSENRNIIESKGIFLPINTSLLIDLCMNKAALNSKLKQLGFKSPKYMLAKNTNNLADIDWFPVVVKPSVGGGGSANVYIAQSVNELMGLAAYLELDKNNQEFVIQQYVGLPEDEYTVGILHDLDGNFIDSVAVRRELNGGLNVRMSVINKNLNNNLGPNLVISSGISQGIIGKFENITNQCREIAEALGSKGPLNFQCRFVEGKVQIFEINPRFSGTTSLRAMIGFNEPDLLIDRHVLGREIETNKNWPTVKIERTLVEHII